MPTRRRCPPPQAMRDCGHYTKAGQQDTSAHEYLPAVVIMVHVSVCLVSCSLFACVAACVMALLKLRMGHQNPNESKQYHLLMEPEGNGAKFEQSASWGHFTVQKAVNSHQT